MLNHTAIKVDERADFQQFHCEDRKSETQLRIQFTLMIIKYFVSQFEKLQSESHPAMQAECVGCIADVVQPNLRTDCIAPFMNSDT